MKKILLEVFLILFILFLVIFSILPFYIMFNVAFKTPEDLVAGPCVPSKSLFVGSFIEAWNVVGRPFLNSMAFTLPATVISSFLGSMAGFVFSKYRFKGDRIILTIVTLGFYVSPQAILVPLIKFISLLGLYNTILGLILTHTAYGMPITTLLFKNYFDTIPKELIESAAIDGAGTATTYSRIMLPLSPPIFAVVSVFQFVNIWNEYLWGLVLTQGAASQTVQVAVANLKGTTLAAWNVQMAGATIAAIPTLMIYLIAFKLVIKGLIQGAVKG